jgi:cell division protein FtsL
MAQLSEREVVLLIVFFILSAIILTLAIIVFVKKRRVQNQEIAKTKEEIEELKKNADVLLSGIDELQKK